MGQNQRNYSPGQNRSMTGDKHLSLNFTKDIYQFTKMGENITLVGTVISEISKYKYLTYMQST